MALFFFFAAAPPPPSIDPVPLRMEPLPFTPKEFYISQVIDERDDRVAIAYLLPPSATPITKNTTQGVDLKGGTLPAIQNFIRQGLPHNLELRPVIVRLQYFRLTESLGTNGQVDGFLMLQMAFDFERDGKRIPLVDYRGGARYSRPANSMAVVEPTIRQALTEALQYLNTWMDEEAHRTERLAQGVKVFFDDHTLNEEDDTVFYAPDRPLIWDDFRAKPRLGSYSAVVFPSFSYEGRTEVVKGFVHLHLTMKVYVLKHSSYVKKTALDEYSLNHEQRHFDLVKLVAERFKQKIRPNNLSVEDYNSIIQYQYIESFREMNRLQEQYDQETRNGIDQMAQQRWNHLIDEELRSFSVLK
jgi:hypothetical protein